MRAPMAKTISSRMIGERVCENPSFRALTETTKENFITLEEARARFIPLLRPIPIFDPVTKTQSPGQETLKIAA